MGEHGGVNVSFACSSNCGTPGCAMDQSQARERIDARMLIDSLGSRGRSTHFQDRWEELVEQEEMQRAVEPEDTNDVRKAAIHEESESSRRAARRARIAERLSHDWGQVEERPYRELFEGIMSTKGGGYQVTPTFPSATADKPTFALLFDKKQVGDGKAGSTISVEASTPVNDRRRTSLAGEPSCDCKEIHLSDVERVAIKHLANSEAGVIEALRKIAYLALGFKKWSPLLVDADGIAERAYSRLSSTGEGHIGWQRPDSLDLQEFQAEEKKAAQVMLREGMADARDFLAAMQKVQTEDEQGLVRIRDRSCSQGERILRGAWDMANKRERWVVNHIEKIRAKGSNAMLDKIKDWAEKKMAEKKDKTETDDRDNKMPESLHTFIRTALLTQAQRESNDLAKSKDAQSLLVAGAYTEQAVDCMATAMQAQRMADRMAGAKEETLEDMLEEDDNSSEGSEDPEHPGWHRIGNRIKGLVRALVDPSVTAREILKANGLPEDPVDRAVIALCTTPDKEDTIYRMGEVIKELAQIEPDGFEINPGSQAVDMFIYKTLLDIDGGKTFALGTGVGDQFVDIETWQDLWETFQDRADMERQVSTWDSRSQEERSLFGADREVKLRAEEIRRDRRCRRSRNSGSERIRRTIGPLLAQIRKATTEYDSDSDVASSIASDVSHQTICMLRDGRECTPTDRDVETEETRKLRGFNSEALKRIRRATALDIKFVDPGKKGIAVYEDDNDRQCSFEQLAARREMHRNADRRHAGTGEECWPRSWRHDLNPNRLIGTGEEKSTEGIMIRERTDLGDQEKNAWILSGSEAPEVHKEPTPGETFWRESAGECWSGRDKAKARAKREFGMRTTKVARAELEYEFGFFPDDHSRRSSMPGKEDCRSNVARRVATKDRDELVANRQGTEGYTWVTKQLTYMNLAVEDKRSGNTPDRLGISDAAELYREMVLSEALLPSLGKRTDAWRQERSERDAWTHGPREATMGDLGANLISQSVLESWHDALAHAERAVGATVNVQVQPKLPPDEQAETTEATLKKLRDIREEKTEVKLWKDRLETSNDLLTAADKSPICDTEIREQRLFRDGSGKIFMIGPTGPVTRGIMEEPGNNYLGAMEAIEIMTELKHEVDQRYGPGEVASLESAVDYGADYLELWALEKSLRPLFEMGCEGMDLKVTRAETNNQVLDAARKSKRDRTPLEQQTLRGIKRSRAFGEPRISKRAMALNPGLTQICRVWGKPVTRVISVRTGSLSPSSEEAPEEIYGRTDIKEARCRCKPRPSREITALASIGRLTDGCDQLAMNSKGCPLHGEGALPGIRKNPGGTSRSRWPCNTGRETTLAHTIRDELNTTEVGEDKQVVATRVSSHFTKGGHCFVTITETPFQTGVRTSHTQGFANLTRLVIQSGTSVANISAIVAGREAIVECNPEQEQRLKAGGPIKVEPVLAAVDREERPLAADTNVSGTTTTVSALGEKAILRFQKMLWEECSQEFVQIGMRMLADFRKAKSTCDSPGAEDAYRRLTQSWVFNQWDKAIAQVISEAGDDCVRAKIEDGRKTIEEKTGKTRARDPVTEIKIRSEHRAGDRCTGCWCHRCPGAGTHSLACGITMEYNDIANRNFKWIENSIEEEEMLSNRAREENAQLGWGRASSESRADRLEAEAHQLMRTAQEMRRTDATQTESTQDRADVTRILSLARQVAQWEATQPSWNLQWALQALSQEVETVKGSLESGRPPGNPLGIARRNTENLLKKRLELERDTQAWHGTLERVMKEGERIKRLSKWEERAFQIQRACFDTDPRIVPPQQFVGVQPHIVKTLAVERREVHAAQFAATQRKAITLAAELECAHATSTILKGIGEGHPERERAQREARLWEQAVNLATRTVRAWNGGYHRAIQAAWEEKVADDL